jgi:GDPmannose 4,6-dehydratase
MKAVIFGVTGQDGSYLSEHLIQNNISVVGVSRRTSSENTSRLVNCIDSNMFKLECGDVTDYHSVESILEKERPDYIFNLAAQSHVRISFDQPRLTFDTVAVGCFNVLQAFKKVIPESRFYQASSSEQFGNSCEKDGTQKETTPFVPESPYAVAKTAAHNFVSCYRNSYKLHASCGILFNHESPRRGHNFVTKKISLWTAKFMHCYENNMPLPRISLGNLNARRDWGHAIDYVNAMKLIVEQETPDDYVVSTGSTYSVGDFLEEACSVAGIDNYQQYVDIDTNLFRPSEVKYLRGNAVKIAEKIGWVPLISFKGLDKDMVMSDYKEYEK